MAREARSKKGFYPVHCCDSYLCDAPANTSVCCPKCNRWQNVAGENHNKMEGDNIAASN